MNASLPPRRDPIPSTISAPINPIMGGVILAVVLCFKLMAVRSFRVDSDETQHAHVVWGWVTGRLQYRDMFDNHMPLFHILCAPYFALFGQYSNILLPLRLAMLPFYGFCLYCVFRLGTILFSKRTGCWACLCASLIPAFFFPSTEFRPDDMWAATWLLTLVVAVSGEFTLKRAFMTGFLLGLTTVVSTKTVFLGAALAVAALCALGLQTFVGSQRLPARQFLLSMLVIAAGGILFPGAIALYFLARGAFPNFLYCVFLHNMVPGLKRWGDISQLVWAFPLTLPLIVAYGVYVFRQAPTVSLATRRVLVLTVPYLYALLMYSYCPDLSRQDNLPYLPLVPLSLVPLAISLSRYCPQPRLRLAFFRYLLPAIILAEIFWTWSAYDLRDRGLRRVAREINTIFSLTSKSDYVMDDKGDYIFRDRPFYWILEPVTRARIRQGSVIDNIPDCLIKTQTKVSYLYPTFPGTDSAKFIAANYLPFDPRHLDIGVAGKVIGNPAPREITSFAVAIPASYAVASEVGETAGKLDGVDYHNPVRLEAGLHHFERTMGSGRLAIIFDKAFAIRFRPLYDQSAQLIKLMSKPDKQRAL